MLMRRSVFASRPSPTALGEGSSNACVMVVLVVACTRLWSVRWRSWDWERRAKFFRFLGHG